MKISVFFGSTDLARSRTALPEKKPNILTKIPMTKNTTFLYKEISIYIFILIYQVELNRRRAAERIVYKRKTEDVLSGSNSINWRPGNGKCERKTGYG